MKPVRDSEGTILNAASLTVDQVVHRKVLCPACGEKVFAMWPEGWDEHAAHRYKGLESQDERTRKAEFKFTFRQLFR